MKKSTLKKLIRAVIQENVGYSHGNIGGPPESKTRDPLTDPLMTGKPINEYSDSDTRRKAVEGRPDDALKLIYAWVKQGAIDYREFVNLLSAVQYTEKGIYFQREPGTQSSGRRGQP
jgi:hypothetical protein